MTRIRFTGGFALPEPCPLIANVWGPLAGIPLGGVTKEHKLPGCRSMQNSRATENLVYSVMSNSPSDPEDVDRPNCSHGNSKIVDPPSNVRDAAGVFEERPVIVLSNAKDVQL